MKRVANKVLASAILVTLIVTIAPNNFLQVVQAEERIKIINADDKELGAMGLAEPTIEEQKVFNENATNIGEIKNNKLAIERIKEEYGDIVGLETPVPIGEEVVEEGSSQKARSYSSSVILPTVVDNSNTKYFPHIGDQGSLGSCAAFATTYYQMTYMMAFENNVDIKSNPGGTFSPKWTYNLNNGGRDNGSSISGNINTLREIGGVDLRIFPYFGKELL